jgi:hypothetical protein
MLDKLSNTRITSLGGLAHRRGAMTHEENGPTSERLA